MPTRMLWLAIVARLSIAPAFVGALCLWFAPHNEVRDAAAGFALLVLCAIHVAYWRRPWPTHPRGAIVSAGAMVLTNAVLIHVFGLLQPLVWLYPALVIGSGLRAPWAAAGVALLAFAAAATLELHGSSVARTLGANHAVLLSIVLAGLGMTAVRQLVEVNAHLHATKAELAELAVADERDRLARELHDLLGRTLAVIAVKAELASRLSARHDPSADAELRDVQRLARDAVREVREAVTGERSLSFLGELESARGALRSAGIEAQASVPDPASPVAHEITLAHALREAVTNVVKHSGAKLCRIELAVAADTTTLVVEDDGRGASATSQGTGLMSLADRVHGEGGSLDVGARTGGGFRLVVRFGDEPDGARRA